jgi:membrane protease YdiL (CAAX protease family)
MEQDRKSTGITNWIYFGLAIITVMVFLLGNVNECDSVQFCATSIFFIVFIGSLVMLTLLWLINPRDTRGKLQDGNVKLFFMQDITIKKLLLVIPGLLIILTVSYLVTFANNGNPDILANPAPFIGIFVSGLVMGIQLIWTKSILIPILTHGIYNSIVVLLREGGGLATFPISVPEVGLSLQGFSDLGAEIIFQNVLVASSEELFKTFIIAFFVVATTGSFKSSTHWVWLGMIVAVMLWTLYHSIA